MIGPTFTCTQQIAIYTDYRQDESYTPSKIAIRAGSHFHDLQVWSISLASKLLCFA